MDHYTPVKRYLHLFTFAWLLFTAISSALLYGLLYSYDAAQFVLVSAVIAWIVLVSLLATCIVSRKLLAPFETLRQAVMHVQSSSSHMPPPDIDHLKTGRELLTSLIFTIYDVASAHSKQDSQLTTTQEATLVSGETVLNSTPLPLYTIAPDDTLRYVNDAGLHFLGLELQDRNRLVGQHINSVLNLAFPSERTLETWLTHCRQSVIKESTTWERVRLINPEGNPLKQFDLAAAYSKANNQAETVLILFDHTERYAADDQEISFVAMAVHELRTPLTVMRGYIEVFEDEIGPTLNAELKDFMHKMNASAQQLTAFVSNILNVARVEENQLTLKLVKTDLKDILTKAIADLELRARVHGKHINLILPQEEISPVMADRISLHEVVNNLVDNAIKYSGHADTITVSVANLADAVQVNVEDKGVGIPDGVVPKLFEKFYRSHRSKVQIGGTGLGLYLCKAIITAHGGNIWVRSHEGQGSTFSFTLEKYNADKHGSESTEQDAIMRGAHGWIKNHSMYRG